MFSRVASLVFGESILGVPLFWETTALSYLCRTDIARCPLHAASAAP